MRWDNLTLADVPAVGSQTALFSRGTVSRTFDTPGFAGITFHETHARSIINRVPESSRVSFRWTINPYRGCTHACVYCFARKTHSYLDFDTGHDFDTQVVVKVNAPELVRRELARPSWRGEPIAIGPNVDCYQRAEGRYQLMRGILGALADAANPFSILTKGTLILRDLDLLTAAARVTDVSTAVSVGCTDEGLWRSVEPGTPSPGARLDVCRRLTDAGIGCAVLMGPILPGLSDSAERLRTTVEAAAAAGARSVTPIVLHLRPGAREWYMAWLAAHHPELVNAYRRLYRGGSYAPAEYQRRITEQVRDLAVGCGIPQAQPGDVRGMRPPPDEHGRAEGRSAAQHSTAKHGADEHRADGLRPRVHRPAQLSLYGPAAEEP